MKNLISLIIIIIMLFSCCFSAAAYDPYEPGSEEYERQRAIEAELLPLLADFVTKETGNDSITKSEAKRS